MCWTPSTTCGDWELAYEHLIMKYGAYSPIHAINNTAWVLLALLFGRGDLDKTLGRRWHAAWTPAATPPVPARLAGIVRCHAYPCTLAGTPDGDALHTAVANFTETRISELARRTARISEKVLFTSNL
jgi:hypothetical protein